MLFLSLLLPSIATAQAPRITGDVGVDLRLGMLTGDVCLTELPGRDSLSFLLNKGLNIASVRNGAGERLKYEGFYNGQMVGEGLLYTVAATSDTLCVAYTGAFPVYPDRDHIVDTKGLIAFNGKTVRAAEQAKWYPVLYEPALDQRTESYGYDLRVRCEGCAAIYVNGARPAPGPEAAFSSDLPRPLVLYAGDYEYRDVGEALFVGAPVSDGAAAIILAGVEAIQEYFWQLLGLPHLDAPAFMAFEPVADVRGWAFASWPTLAYAGAGAFDGLLAAERGEAIPAWLWRSLAHEMAHYYFGTLREPGGPYAWFYTESMAEYLGLKAMRRFAGEEAYRSHLRTYAEVVRDGPLVVPLDEVQQKDQIHSTYRYQYGPLLLIALEERVGEERMGRMLSEILTGPPDTPLDYALLRSVALAADVSEEVWVRFERECVRPRIEESCLGG